MIAPFGFNPPLKVVLALVLAAVGGRLQVMLAAQSSAVWKTEKQHLLFMAIHLQMTKKKHSTLNFISDNSSIFHNPRNLHKEPKTVIGLRLFVFMFIFLLGFLGAESSV